MKALTVADINYIVESIRYRQAACSEDLGMSIRVVLANCGDRLTQVRCVANCWQGTKADLSPWTGFPRCPDGHPLIVPGTLHVLGLVPRSGVA